MSPIPFPLTAAMRHLTIGAFFVSLIGLVVWLVEAVVTGFVDVYEAFPVFALWFLCLLMSVIGYQICRLREEGQPGDEEAVLLMAALAEIKAMRSEHAEAEVETEIGEEERGSQ